MWKCKKNGSFRSIYNPTKQTTDFINFLKFMTELLTLNKILFIQPYFEENLRLPVKKY